MDKEHLFAKVVTPRHVGKLNRLEIPKLDQWTRLIHPRPPQLTQAPSGGSFSSLFVLEPPSHPPAERCCRSLGSTTSNIYPPMPKNVSSICTTR
uniref:Uncharacterized protein n=1 Tax=Arundo donax TaxID=35708 RepID=A0A0A9AQF3_ARUDO